VISKILISVVVVAFLILGILIYLELRFHSRLLDDFIREFRIHFDDALVRRIMKKLNMSRFH